MIELRVTEQDGIPRSRWPVYGGLALPRGWVTRGDELRLQDGAGGSAPLQVQVMTYWPDASARWVLLDFQADLGAHGTALYHLDRGRQEPLPLLQMGSITDGEPVPGRPGVTDSYVKVVDCDGHEWPVREAGATVIEEHNGLRAVVRTSGCVSPRQEEPGLRWEARTEFFLGHEWTRTRFTYVIEALDCEVRLRELAVVTHTALPGDPSYCFAGSMAPWNAETTPLCTPQAGLILQTDANDSRVVATGGEVLRDQTLKNRGYVGAQVDGVGVAMGLSEMWQSFPKALRATPSGLEASLWPAEAGADFSPGRGIARTHTLTVTPFYSAEDLDVFMGTINTPLVPQMDIASWHASKVMRPLLPPHDSPVPFIEELSKALFTGFTTSSTRANCGVWGLGELHWGDFRAESYEARQVAGTYGEGVVWGNLEAQVPYGLLVQYIRTGRIEYLLHGLACARHEADVDTIHDWPDADWVGRQHAHSAGHTCGIVTISHEWTSGIALAYLLTGDGRLRAVLEQTGRALKRIGETAELSAFRMRDGGWLLIALCALYEALGDPDYLQAGSRVMRGLHGWIEEGAKMPLPPAQHVHSPVHLFIALTGVADYLRLTGDASARETLLAGGRLALDRSRNEAGFFFVADGQAYRNAGAWPACHSLPVLSDLFELTGDREWLEVGAHQAGLLLRLLQARTQWGQEENWAQGGIYFSYAFAFFHAAHEAGLLQDI